MVGIQTEYQEQPGKLPHVTVFSKRTQGSPFSLGLDGRRFSRVWLRKTAGREISPGPALLPGKYRSIPPYRKIVNGLTTISCSLLYTCKKSHWSDCDK